MHSNELVGAISHHRHLSDTLSRGIGGKYRIIPAYDEVSTITYDLIYDANVSIDIYDPDGSYFTTLLNNEPQDANSYEIIWYGTDKEPNDPNSRYIATEGVYRVVVGVQSGSVTEEMEGAITAYR